MNADNTLEPDALVNFRQMARVGSSSEVNVLVQFDRIGKYAHTNPDWSQTLRFRMNKGIQPIPRYALEDLGEMDMGDTATLHKFVSWSKRKYPAEHYLLIIWDHGAGWRFRFAPPTNASGTDSSGNRAGRPLEQSPYRSISVDETNDNHKLYNRGIQEALSGEGIDILGFDACLMSMLETAFAFKEIASYMVASEELIPGLGWRYDDWLARLLAKPNMEPRDLATVLVASYKKTYMATDPTTTLSAVDLSKVEPLSASVSNLADLLRQLLRTQPTTIFEARSHAYEYAPNPFGDGKNYFHHVDLGRFAALVAARLTSLEARKAAARVLASLQQAVMTNYAGSARQGAYGSTGLAIYFPISGTAYRDDAYEEGGYRKDNHFWPVAFVQETTWPDFLSAYFAKVK